MAAKKKAARKASGGSDAMIISKSRVKAAAKKSNVGSEFYGALEAHVREVIACAEARAAANGRKTLRPQDV
jgi:histone H3/H4